MHLGIMFGFVDFQTGKYCLRKSAVEDHRRDGYV